jgi:hypothetical protein
MEIQGDGMNEKLLTAELNAERSLRMAYENSHRYWCARLREEHRVTQSRLAKCLRRLRDAGIETA